MLNLTPEVLVFKKQPGFSSTDTPVVRAFFSKITIEPLVQFWSFIAAGEAYIEAIQVAHVNISDSTAPTFQYEDGENDDSVFPGMYGSKPQRMSITPLS